MFKKILAAVLCICLLTALCTPLALADTAPAFTDIKGHWAQEIITKWAGQGILAGNNGKFRPNDPLTKAELCTVINRLLRLHNNTVIPADKIKPGSWYAQAVNNLAAKDLIWGLSYGWDGDYGMSAPARRMDAANILCRVLYGQEGLDYILYGYTALTPSFLDTGSLNGEYTRNAIQYLKDRGYLMGNNGAFRPFDNLTRAEAITMIARVFGTLITAPGTYAQSYDGNVTVLCSGVDLSKAKINGDLIVADDALAGEVYCPRSVVSGRFSLSPAFPGGYVANTLEELKAYTTYSAKTMSYSHVYIKKGVDFSSIQGKYDFSNLGVARAQIHSLTDDYSFFLMPEQKLAGYTLYSVSKNKLTSLYLVRFDVREGLDALNRRAVIFETLPEGTQNFIKNLKSASDEINRTCSTDFDKIKAAHDYVCLHMDYGKGGIQYEYLGAFGIGYGVCEDYSYSYYLLSRCIGIECYWVLSLIEGDHAYNIVKMNGSYYNLDCTWDDSLGLTGGGNYGYFLKTDAEFQDGGETAHTPINDLYPKCTTVFDSSHIQRIPKD